ncbi:MAG: helix-turn-helix domain-containing protein [Acidobacteria bacterium]|nr:helix-turn-helix domain-containing protein [Acidobacteriota bacterium]
MNTLGDHIRNRRRDLGLLQREVAAQIGVDPDTIWNWESNATTPALTLIPRVINFLGYVPFVLAGSLTEKLALFRKTRGLSIRQLAGELGVDPSTLAGWEAGRHKPERKFLDRIEELLR